MERKEGFYWVRYSNYWMVAEWTGTEWNVTHNIASYYDEEFVEINETRLLAPNER